MIVRLLTIQEAAERLNISKQAVWQKISTGELQTIVKDNILYVVLPPDPKKAKKGRKIVEKQENTGEDV